jgi:predicted O-linked N-acetylglucosamine transferase (SPINDLY family)
MARALLLHKSGQTDEALAIYSAILENDPNNADALHLSGLIYAARQNLLSAVPLLEKAAEIKPLNPVFLADLGQAFIDVKNFGKAIDMFTRCIQIDAGNARFHSGLALALRNAGRMPEAAMEYRAAAEISPQTFAHWFNAGMAFYSVCEYKNAAADLRTAVNLCPSNSDARRLLGVSLHETGFPDEAELELKSACSINPECPDCLYSLANVLRDMGKADTALICYGKAIALKPGFTQAETNMADLLQAIGEPVEAMEIYRKIIKREPDCRIAVSNALLCLNYDSKTSCEELFSFHKLTVSACYKENQYPTHRRVHRHEKHLRIGYISPDFRLHPVACFLLPVLKNHDRKTQAIFCYSNVKKPDRYSEVFEKLSNWRDISAINDNEARNLIMQDNIDVLIDLSGHTADNRLGIFESRAAPVQVSYCGYPATTALNQMDFRITDAVADPAGAKTFYTEKLIRLSGCFLCYSPLVNAPEPCAEAVDKRSVPVFGSFNNPAKISDSTIAVWSRILMEFPESVLMLKYLYLDQQQVIRKLQKRFELHGINPVRILCFGKTVSFEDHLRMYDSVDIALDTFPYNGTTTTCEALWMGVPVICLRGDRSAGRTGASILSACGLKENIAETKEEYIQMAVQSINDRARLSKLRRTLRNALSVSPLCDARKFTKQFEDALDLMCR